MLYTKIERNKRSIGCMIEEIEKNIDTREESLDTRELMTDRINPQRKDRSIRFLLGKLKKGEYVFRNFNLEETWQRGQETYFIESLLLQCEIQPISIYLGKEQGIIIDGFQRVRAIERFFKNEATLTEGGLQKLHFLANQKLKDLPDDYQEFLLDNCKIKVIEYENVKKQPLSNIEEEFIQKEIYIRYNTGLRLKPFEIQKAQFDEDEISQKLKIWIHNEKIKEKLKAIGILGEKETESNYEKAMVKIRKQITSTYCPFSIYCKLRGDNRIATEGYIPYVSKQNKEKVIEIFLKTITFLYKIIQNKKYQKYEQLHTKPYLESSYWLYSTILKNEIIREEDFDINLYIDYCHHNNSSENYFNAKKAYTGNKMKERMVFVSNFLRKFYSISMENYFEKEEVKKSKKKEPEKITFQELENYQYVVGHKDCDITEFLDNIKHERYIFHPSYQREEVIDRNAASALIESSFCKIAIPDILVYRYYVDGKAVNEIVDGQQRSTTYAAFTGKEYLDENKQLRKSNKHKFSLGKMRIFKDCEGKTYHESKKQLNPYFIEKLNQANLHLAYIDEKHNPHFDPRDHFVRINKNITPLRPHSFLMWNVSCDRWITKRICEVTEKYKGSIFKQKMKRRAYEQIMVSLMYIEAREKENLSKNKKEIDKWQSISMNTLTNFMEKIKDTNRKEYYDYIEEISKFLNKINKWLKQVNMNLHDIFHVKIVSFPSIKNYHYLYFLLHSFTEEMLLKEADNILKIVETFYQEEKEKEYKDKAKYVEETRKKLMDLYRI